MRDWISDVYCEECYSWLTVTAHNNGEQLDYPDYLKPIMETMPMIAGKSIMIHFKAPPRREERDEVIVATELRPRIFLGGRNGGPMMFIGNETIQLDPSLCEVHVSKAFHGSHVVSKIDLMINQEIRYMGRPLCGKFTKAALLGNVICNNAYYGECITINQHLPTIPVRQAIKELKNEVHQAHIDGKDQRVIQSLNQTIAALEASIAGLTFPDPNWLNEEVCVYPGVVGVIQPTSNPRNNICEWVNVGKFCSRCADYNNKVKAQKESSVSTPTTMRSAPQVVKPVLPSPEDYDRLNLEIRMLKEQNEALIDDLKAMERTLKIVATTKSDEKTRRPLRFPTNSYVL